MQPDNQKVRTVVSHLRSSSSLYVFEIMVIIRRRETTRAENFFRFFSYQSIAGGIFPIARNILPSGY
jgi:hypothetical protein